MFTSLSLLLGAAQVKIECNDISSLYQQTGDSKMPQCCGAPDASFVLNENVRQLCRPASIDYLYKHGLQTWTQGDFFNISASTYYQVDDVPVSVANAHGTIISLFQAETNVAAEPFKILLPENYASSTDEFGLFIVSHGASRSLQMMLEDNIAYGLASPVKLADGSVMYPMEQSKFIVVLTNGPQGGDGEYYYPTGYSNLDNLKNPNKPHPSSTTQTLATDIKNTIAYVKSNYRIDASRVFIGGSSNGGLAFLSVYPYLADGVSGWVGIGASLSRGATYGFDQFATAALPPHLLRIHGTADDLILKQGSVGLMSVDGMFKYVGKKYDATFDIDITQTSGESIMSFATSALSVPNPTVRYRTSVAGADFEYIEITNGEHISTNLPQYTTGAHFTYVFEWMRNHPMVNHAPNVPLQVTYETPPYNYYAAMFAGQSGLVVHDNTPSVAGKTLMATLAYRDATGAPAMFAGEEMKYLNGNVEFTFDGNGGFTLRWLTCDFEFTTKNDVTLDQYPLFQQTLATLQYQKGNETWDMGYSPDFCQKFEEGVLAQTFTGTFTQSKNIIALAAINFDDYVCKGTRCMWPLPEALGYSSDLWFPPGYTQTAGQLQLSEDGNSITGYNNGAVASSLLIDLGWGVWADSFGLSLHFV